MRIPRRAAVVLSAVALSGALTACADDAETEGPVAPNGGVGGEIDDEGDPESENGSSY